MDMRNEARRRRQERVGPWTGAGPEGGRGAPEPERLQGGRIAEETGRSPAAYEEPDPERWWKERQRSELARSGRGGERSGGDGGKRGSGPGGDGGRARGGFSFARPDGAKPVPVGGAAGPQPGAPADLPPGAGTGPIGSWSSLKPYAGLSGRSGGWDEDPPPSGFGEFVRRLVRGTLVRAVVAALLLGGAWGWFHLKLPGSAAAQLWTIRTVTEDMDFDAVEAWYEKTFGGSPSFLPAFKRQEDSQAVSASWSRDATVAPLDGRVVQTFAQTGRTGIRMSAPAGSSVQAVHAGRVTQVTLDDQGNATILVQHTNRVVSVYGNIEAPAVKPADWVEAGQELGQLAPISSEGGGEGLLYFAVKQNGKTLDPAEVIPVD